MKILSLLVDKVKTRFHKVVTWIKEDWDRGQMTWKKNFLILFAAGLFATGFTLMRNGDEGFLPVFLISLFFILLIVYFDLVMNMESLLVLEEKRKPRGIWFLFLLVVKNILISFLMVLLSFMLVIFFLSHFNITDESLQVVFVFAFMVTFFLAFTFYWFFSESPLRQKLNIFFSKPHHLEKNSAGLPELRRYQEQLEDMIELSVIIATVGLLGTSVFSSVDIVEAGTTNDIYSTIEFRMTMWIMPIYIQAAYYKLRQILDTLNSHY